MSESDYGRVTGLWYPEEERRPGDPANPDVGFPGVDLDGPQEVVSEESERAAQELLRRSKPRWVQFRASVQTDGSGNAGVVARQIEEGLLLTLGWIVITSGNSSDTPAAPYTSGWVGIYSNPKSESAPDFEDLIDFGPSAPGAGVVPIVFEYGGMPGAGRVLAGPRSLAVRLVGLRASTQYQVIGQGQLARLQGLE